jgi:hypothetical protein
MSAKVLVARSGQNKTTPRRRLLALSNLDETACEP